MIRVGKFAIRSFFFTTLLTTQVISDPYSEFRDNAINCGIASEVVHRTTSNVYINNKAYEVYVFDFNYDEPIHTYTVSEHADDNTDTTKTIVRRFYANTINKLYICINCEFAEWALNKLVRLLEPFPSFYQRKFQAEHDSTYMKFCKQSAAAFEDIIKYNEKFINILLNFQNVFLSKRDTTVDTDNLTSLLLMIFKINFLSELCSGEPTVTVEYSDTRIIRLILELLNSFQNYVYTNCKLSSDNDTRQLYGIFINTDNKDIDTFLADIGPLKLEPTNNCDTKQMLLINAIPGRFENVKWTTEYGETTVEIAVQKLEESHDPPIIFWYLNRVFETILKMLFTKIQIHFKENQQYLSADSVRDLKTVHAMLSDNMNLPNDLNECFLLVTSKRGDEQYIADDETTAKIAAFINSLNNIDLGKDENTHVDPRNTDFGSVNDSINSSRVSTAGRFITFLKFMIEDLKCFVKLFEYFRNKGEITYYMPFTDNMHYRIVKIKSFEEEISIRKINENQSTSTTDNRDNTVNRNIQDNYEILKNDGCKFFGDLYHICFVTTVDLNLVHSANNYPDYLGISNLNIFSRIEKYIKTITDVLVSFTSYYSHHPHFRTISNILPSLVFKKASFYTESNCIDLQRMMYVIMNELNNYSIEYCNPPQHNFLFFNNINFQSIGRIMTVHEEIISLFHRMKNKSGVFFPQYTFEYLKEFFNAVITDTNFSEYDEIIMMNWKGGKMNIRHIFVTLASSVVSAFNLFGFYDYSFIFCFAMLFVETFKIQKSQQTEAVKNTLLFFFNTNGFPMKFDKVIRGLIDVVNFHISYGLNNTRETVENAFATIGVYFNNLDLIKERDVNESKKILKTITVYLSAINREFLMLI